MAGASAALCQEIVGGGLPRSQSTDSREQLRFLLFKELNSWKLTHLLKMLPRMDRNVGQRFLPVQRNPGPGGALQGEAAEEQPCLGAGSWDGSSVSDSPLSPWGAGPPAKPREQSCFFQPGPGSGQDLMPLVILCEE